MGRFTFSLNNFALNILPVAAVSKEVIIKFGRGSITHMASLFARVALYGC